MTVDWIYDSPTWLWGALFVLGTIALACLGLAIFHRLVNVELRQAHNDLAGFTIAVMGVVYAVLLAFIAVATWERFSSADAVVQAEAGTVDGLYRDTQGFPDAVAEALRKTIREYADTVVHAEWPVQMRGEVPTAGWEPLHKLHAQLVSFQPANRGQAVIQAEFLRNLNELYKARGARLTAAATHVPIVIWWIIVIGGALTTAFTYLFGFKNFCLHLTMTGALAALLALVIVLIVALDWPLRGEVGVPPEAYVYVERSWDLVSRDAGSQSMLAPAAKTLARPLVRRETGLE
jgi:hypothetical protein